MQSQEPTLIPFHMPNFFISYRRADSDGNILAHMLFRELRHKYPKDLVFLDVDSRSPGLPFSEKVREALDRTDALLVVIGPQWIQLLRERQGESRDWVQYEISEGLRRSGLPVVPVCHTGVRVPAAEELPTALQDLALRDGVTIDPTQDFDSHLNRLLVDLERVIEKRDRTRSHSPLARNPTSATDPTIEEPEAHQDLPSDSSTEQSISQRLSGVHRGGINIIPFEPTTRSKVSLPWVTLSVFIVLSSLTAGLYFLKPWSIASTQTIAHDGPSTEATRAPSLNNPPQCEHIHDGREELVGTWWQFTMSTNGSTEQSAVSFMEISYKDDCSLKLRGRSWKANGFKLAQYGSDNTSFKKGDGLSYNWEGHWSDERGTTTKFSGKGEIRTRSKDQASGYFTSRYVDRRELGEEIRTEYLRAQPKDSRIIDGSDAEQRKDLIVRRLDERKAIAKH